MLPSLGGIGGIGNGAAGAVGTGGAAGAPSFGDALKSFVNQTTQAQHTAAEMSVAAASGDSVALQDVVQAISRAELTLQTMVSVRDKAVEAYKEIMSMPV